MSNVMTQAESSAIREPTLRRYTDLPALLYMLRRKKLTLLNPAMWDDKNDSHYLNLYKERKQLGAVLALCFTEVGETYHHWRVFSPGLNGICVRFDRQMLLEHMGRRPGVRAGPAQYKMMDHVRKAALSVEDLPFLKRYAFRDEHEFRLVFESKRAVNTRDFPLPTEFIKRITISPWLNDGLAEAIWETIRSIDGCKSLVVGQSSLVNNNEWKKLGARAA